MLPVSTKRRTLLNRFGTVFNKPTRPSDMSQSTVEDLASVDYSTLRNTQPVSSLLSPRKSTSSSPLNLPNESAWSSPSVPVSSSRPKPPPLVLHSSNLTLKTLQSISTTATPSLALPHTSDSPRSPQPSPASSLFATPQPSPSILLSASSVPTSPSNSTSAASSPSRIIRRRTSRSVGPPLSPPPSYPIPSVPTTPTSLSVPNSNVPGSPGAVVSPSRSRAPSLSPSVSFSLSSRAASVVRDHGAADNFLNMYESDHEDRGREPSRLHGFDKMKKKRGDRTIEDRASSAPFASFPSPSSSADRDFFSRQPLPDIPRRSDDTRTPTQGASSPPASNRSQKPVLKLQPVNGFVAPSAVSSIVNDGKHDSMKDHALSIKTASSSEYLTPHSDFKYLDEHLVSHRMTCLDFFLKF